MRMLLALSCFALMISGCRPDSVAQLTAPQRPATSPPKKPSPAPSLVKTAKAPAKPAAGPGEAPKPAPDRPCPDLEMAVYAALEAPTALPAVKGGLSPDATKAWIGALEGQVGSLRGHLREVVTTYDGCRPPSSVAGTPAPAKTP